MDISKIGKIALLDRLNDRFDIVQNSTLRAFDDAAVVASGKGTKQICSNIFLEGIHFNLVYTPLQHLGYKTVTQAVSNIVAMNSHPRQILVSVAVSSRFKLADIELLYDGIRSACSDYGLELLDNNLTASLTGMTVGITCIGEAKEEALCYRGGAGVNDLICLSGSLGAAYVGLQVLERERYVFEQNPQAQPQLEGYDYVLRKQLHPQARTDMTAIFAEQKVKPSSMTDIADCLASDLLQICKQSSVGARIYLDRIPIASETIANCQEMNIDPVTAALNGGDDFELLFTVPLAKYEQVKSLAGFEVIGHITDAAQGAYLVTPEGEEIKITAQGWTESV